MKRIVYLFFAASILFACSSDDDGPQFRLAINSGGPSLMFQGIEWVEDQYVTGNKTFINEVDIESTDNDTLFHTESFNGSFTYEIPLAGTGPYTVELHFAEIFHGIMNSNGEGARVFNVDIEEGQGTLTSYDIFAKAGGPAIAIKEQFPGIMIEDGSLTVVFSAIQGDAKISGIEISGNM